MLYINKSQKWKINEIINRKDETKNNYYRQNGIDFMLENMQLLSIDEIKKITDKNIPIKSICVMGAKEVQRQDPAERNNYSLEEYIQLRKSVDKILAEIDLNSTEEEKFLKIYKRLGESIVYDFDEDGEASNRDEAHNLKGGLLEGKCVCEGYALALKQVLKCAGIECRFLAYQQAVGSEEAEGHAWNQVKLGGKWYNCDLTWDSVHIHEGNTLQWCLLNDTEFINHDKYKKLCEMGENCEVCSETYDQNKIKSIIYPDKYAVEDIRKQMEWYYKGQTMLTVQDINEYCTDYGLDFNQEMGQARDRVELRNEMDNTDLTTSDKSSSLMMGLSDRAGKLGLDFETEIENSTQRNLLRKEMKNYFLGKSEMSVGEIDAMCSYLGLNYNYEMEDAKTLPIATEPKNAVKNIATGTLARDVRTVSSEIKNNYHELENPVKVTEDKSIDE